MKSKTQYQVGIRASLSSSVRDRVAAFLSLAGDGLCSLVEEEGKRGRTVSLYLKDKKQSDRLFVLCQAARIIGAKPFRCVHREKDWSSRWKEGWKPFSLTRKFHVVPLWQEKRDCPKGKIPVYLDTTNAFGTGLHETTRFTAQIIEGLSGRFSSFLDVGTGSGILAVVALKCGAVKCVGIDIDPGAVKVARQNLKANRLTCFLKACDLNDFKPAHRFDLVAANLVSPDLIEFRDRILSFVRPGGYLVVSGISLANVKRVNRSFFLAGLRPVKVIKGREWAAMLFKV